MRVGGVSQLSKQVIKLFDIAEEEEKRREEVRKANAALAGEAGTKVERPIGTDDDRQRLARVLPNQM